MKTIRIDPARLSDNVQLHPEGRPVEIVSVAQILAIREMRHGLAVAFNALPNGPARMEVASAMLAACPEDPPAGSTIVREVHAS